MAKKDGPGSANRALDKAMKSKGLQKLRWYCQVCEKQCRDENGFKCHTMSEGHLRQMLVVGESAGKHISDYSSRFQAEFVGLLSRRWGTKRTRVNQVYQEYISDKQHLHMNATRWLSLTEFTKHLGRTGVAHVDETEKGWFLSWIDNSPKALAKAEAHQKKERGDMDEESRQRKLIQEQIERARDDASKRRNERLSLPDTQDERSAVISNSTPAKEEHESELRRQEGEGISLSLSFNARMNSPSGDVHAIKQPVSDKNTLQEPSFTPLSLSSSVRSQPPPKNLALKSAKVNPLKSNNPLRPGATVSLPLSATSTLVRKRPLSAVESIAQEEIARKKRLEEARKGWM